MNQYLGTELYGVWQSLIALTGIIQLLALGVPMATVRFISKYVATKDDDQLQKIVSTCAGIFLIISFVSLFFGVFLAYIFNSFYSEELTSSSIRSVALIAVSIIVISSSFSFIGRFPYSIMAGYRYFIPLNIMNIIMVFFKSSLVLCVLVSTQSLVHLAIVECIVLACDFALGYFYLRKKHPRLSLGFSGFEKNLVAIIFSFGGYVLFINLGTKLSFQIDALVIAKSLSLKEVTYYGISNALLVQLIGIMLAIAGVVMPEASKYDAENKRIDFYPILLKWSKIALSISFLIGIYLIVVGPEFVSIWMGDFDFFHPTQQVLPILILSSFFFLPMRAIALPMLFGFGEVKKPALAFFFTGLFNLGLSIALVGQYGLIGVAIGTAIPNIVFSFYILNLACRSVNIKITYWFLYVTLKCAIGALISLFFLITLKNFIVVSDFLSIFMLGIPYTLVFVLLSIFFIFNKDPYIDFKKIIFKKVRIG